MRLRFCSASSLNPHRPVQRSEILRPFLIDEIRESALLVSKTLGMLAKEIKPGINTLYLDSLAESFIRDHNAEPGFLGLYDFPNTLCISPNSQVVHGIPNKDEIKDGDILSIDCVPPSI